MVVVWGMNVLLVLSVGGIAWLGGHVGVEFCMGMIFASAIYNIGHRMVYHRWF